MYKRINYFFQFYNYFWTYIERYQSVQSNKKNKNDKLMSTQTLGFNDVTFVIKRV